MLCCIVTSRWDCWIIKSHHLGVPRGCREQKKPRRLRLRPPVVWNHRLQFRKGPSSDLPFLYPLLPLASSTEASSTTPLGRPALVHALYYTILDVDKDEPLDRSGGLYRVQKRDGQPDCPVPADRIVVQQSYRG